jgi:hypothetical protein
VFWDYGVLPEVGIHGKADLYLHGEDGLNGLTDYNCSFRAPKQHIMFGELLLDRGVSTLCIGMTPFSP